MENKGLERFCMESDRMGGGNWKKGSVGRSGPSDEGDGETCWRENWWGLWKVGETRWTGSENMKGRIRGRGKHITVCAFGGGAWRDSVRFDGFGA